MLPPGPSPLRHPCLSPTYTRSMFEGGFEVLRPSVRGAPSPTTHSERLLAAARRRIILCNYLQPWRGTARGLQSFGACTATRMQLEGRNVPCKQYCASGLHQHLIICTEDVTAARRTLQRLHIFSRDTTTASVSSIFSSCNPINRTSAN